MQSRKKIRSKTSLRVLQVCIIVLGLIILGRLFQLQILDYDTYNPLSRENSLRQEVVNPARGLIYDRNGNLIVDNQPIYTITVTPASYDPKNTPILSEIMNVPVEEVENRVKKPVTTPIIVHQEFLLKSILKHFPSFKKVFGDFRE